MTFHALSGVVLRCLRDGCCLPLESWGQTYFIDQRINLFDGRPYVFV